MRCLVVYESMYGNTHAIADEIARGLRTDHEVRVVPVAQAGPDLQVWAEALIVGGPTHVHGLTSAMSRKSAREAAAKPDSDLHMDQSADGIGLRDWLAALDPLQGKRVACFDTRFDGPVIFTGRASKAIERRLRGRGGVPLCESASFLVDKHNHVVDGEPERARRWGAAAVASPPVAAGAGQR